MKKYKQGFAIPLIIAIIALLGIGGGAYVYVNKNKIIDIKKEGVGNSARLVVNTESLNKAVVKKYKNPAGVSKQIKASLNSVFVEFSYKNRMLQAKDLSYINACLNAKPYIKTEIENYLKNDIENNGFLAGLGITLDSYDFDQIICKANADNYIVTIPTLLEDGTTAKFCLVAEQIGGIVGDANYDTFTCIQK
jgi:hypothetical protein